MEYLFKLIWSVAHPYETECDTYIVIGDRESIFNLWFNIKNTTTFIKVVDMNNIKQHPENGITGLVSSKVTAL